jgi:hypothetical protein
MTTKNNENFLERFLICFFVCAFMAFCTTFCSVALGNATTCIPEWGKWSTGFFGVTFFLGLIASVIFSKMSTDENEICPGDIPISYDLRSLTALSYFMAFAVVSFIVVYCPFAIGYSSFNPQNWGKWGVNGDFGASSGWAGFLLLVSMIISCCSAWYYAEQKYK